MDRDSITNRLLLRNTVFPKPSTPKTQASMSPSAGEVAQTPEPKSSSAFSIFKSLTGGKSSKSPSAQSPAPLPRHLNGANTLQSAAIYGGPPNYEKLYAQLRIGNALADRIAAADALRHAVHDYPLSGVRKTSCDQLGIFTN